MTAGRWARVALVVIHVTSALVLAVPLIIGLAHGGFGWRFFDFAVARFALAFSGLYPTWSLKASGAGPPTTAGSQVVLGTRAPADATALILSRSIACDCWPGFGTPTCPAAGAVAATRTASAARPARTPRGTPRH